VSKIASIGGKSAPYEKHSFAQHPELPAGREAKPQIQQTARSSKML
jgi:hypothetical protein